MMIGEGLGVGWTVKMLSLNSIRCGNILKLIFILISTIISIFILYINVKMILKVKKIIRLQYYTNKILHQRLNIEHLPLFKFNEWLIGFTDGDGTFSMTKGINGHYQFTLKLSQSIYNYRILYFIKKQIGYGSITKDGPNNLQYRIRDTKILKEIIIPIFESYPLHTSKYYSYNLWKEALLDPKKRDINKSKFKELPNNYISPNNNIPTKNWIIGFIEA